MSGFLLSLPPVKPRIVRSLVCLLAFSFSLPACRAADSNNDYGKKVRFEKGESINFPDFSLEYRGQRREASPRYSRGFLFYDFVAKTEHGSVPVSWSSGTGEIAPTRFKIGADEFEIELKRSDKLGPLKDDELVVTALAK